MINSNHVKKIQIVFNPLYPPFIFSFLQCIPFVAGVPPDYFSETGQLWGNPVYKWDALKKRKYEWWIKRIKHNLNLF
ncbi:MAG: 4-alpha-glucanotransferase, partial [Deltaproteobacteria bacterium]|nr:4-alpha-glucanotransferase [Deltaproteobacteria bacterium]